MYKDFSYQKSKVKTDYQRHKLSNPFKSESRERKNKFSWPQSRFWRIAMALIIVATLIWFIFFSNFWSITKIDIQGMERISREEIEIQIQEQLNKKVFYFASQKNVLFLHTEELEQTLNDKYNFEYLSIIKKIPHTLKLTIKERPRDFIWQEGGKSYYCDENAYIISEVDPNDSEQKKYQVMENRSQKLIDKNKVSYNLDDIKFTKELMLLLNVPGFKINKYIFDEQINFVKVDLQGGPMLYFNTKGNIEGQLKNLQIIHEEKLKEDFKKKKYIDLRSGDTIFIGK
ncbi:MAG: hypothetical protein MUF50_02060 [Planctomycetes bacterium]|jgi:cell division septal protein FtsQ|nr:hypothetical protein [Planctomycetota bacterium]